MSFTPCWDWKPTIAFHADSPGVYTSDKSLKIGTKDEIVFKCNVIDGSILDGVGQPILYCFLLNQPAGYKIHCEPETIFFEKVNKSVLNTKSFFIRNKKLILTTKRWLIFHNCSKFELLGEFSKI